jgi:hypothetical protein
VPRGYVCVPYDEGEEPQACVIAVCVGHAESCVSSALETVQSLFYEHHMVYRIPCPRRPFYHLYGVLICGDREFDLERAVRTLPREFEVHHPGGLERVKDFFQRMGTDFRKGGGPVLVADGSHDARGAFREDPYFGGECLSTDWTEEELVTPTFWAQEGPSEFCDWMECEEIYPEEESSDSSCGETWAV